MNELTEASKRDFEKEMLQATKNSVIELVLRGYNSDAIAARLGLRKDDVRTYLQQLIAEHAAELAAMLAKEDTEMERLKGLLTIYFRAQQEKTT